VTEQFIIGDRPVTIEDVVAVANGELTIGLGDQAKERVIASRKNIEKIVASGKPAYGVNTGIGNLKSVTLNGDEIDQFQINLLVSHAAGTGPLFSHEVTRAAMFLRACSLAGGFSGIRLETLELLIDFINYDICPHVPQKGSVGSSGDLAPLSHIAMALTGQGDCYHNGRKQPVALALKLSGLEPAKLKAKEGLALINGTQFMTALLALCVYQAEILVESADICGSLTLEAAHGLSSAFVDRLHQLRPHPGQLRSASNVRAITSGSKLLDKEPERIQDGYSIRCAPVVHGASRDTIGFVRQQVEIELNSTTDNPSIFAEDDVISGGNFHGQPMALAADFLGIAISELGNISERRINRLVDRTFTHLPPFLAPKPGLHSGLMIPHYTAAALASENKGLAHPNSADSIPTSDNQEDHNSMGTIAARNCWSIIENVTTILGIEAMTAAQALEFSDWQEAGAGSKMAYENIRTVLDPWTEDRFVHPDIETMRDYIASGELLTQLAEVLEEAN